MIYVGDEEVELDVSNDVNKSLTLPLGNVSLNYIKK